MICVNCGEKMAGDGYSTVIHCPRVDVIGSDFESDANPVYCHDRESITAVEKMLEG